MNLVYALIFISSGSFSHEGYFANPESCMRAKELLHTKSSFQRNQIVCLSTGFSVEDFKSIKAR